MRFFRLYFDSFKGLSREVWYLALVTFINRAGTMVVPFLSLYLTSDLHYTLENVGWIMSAFGLGSVAGSWLGGKLCTKFGFYPVMFWSLFISGIIFVLIQFIESFYGLCVGVFILMMVADTFRPASFVAINSYSKKEDSTRSISLYRLAINLGFSFGPALGGLIITSLSYGGLFWVDGITCIMAAFLFISLLSAKNSKHLKNEEKEKKHFSPYKDKSFLLLILIVFLIAFTFLQYFSTIPLYYSQVQRLSEDEIGYLMALNGGLIFLVEMPLIKKLDQDKYSKYTILQFSIILLALSFLVLNFFSGWGVLVIGMLFMTFGEIFNFPFINSLCLKFAQKGNTGEYMALYSMAFSLAHILGHKSGMQLIGYFGYQVTWYIMAGILLLALVLISRLKKSMYETV